MQNTPLSTCERNFITQAIKQNQRLDGRKNDEFRNMAINFGSDWGSVLCALGETKVLAQVSCELGIPKATRPTEGMMYINLETGAGRNTELNVQINRTLERTFKDSRCVDLESLCVTAEERVWILRVDLNALNNEGNLIDCSSIATLAALMHFKRPDVSIIDDDVRIHTAAEKEPIPMVLHHYPVCVSYCTFDEGNIAVADPTAIEERTAESLMNKIVFGLNSFRELCCLNLGGTTLSSSTLLLQCAKRAAYRARYVVDCVKAALEKDKEMREAGQNVGFTKCLQSNEKTYLSEDRLALKLRNFTFKDICETVQTQDQELTQKKDENDSDYEERKALSIASNSVVLNSNQSNIKWMSDDDDEDENIVNMDSDNATVEEDDMDTSLATNVEKALLMSNQKRSNNPTSKQPRLLSTKNLQEIHHSDSEEETTMVL